MLHPEGDVLQRGVQFHHRRSPPARRSGAARARRTRFGPKGGVVHDLPKELIYIQDIGDGGSKSDKFERDERLRQELKEEPDNERDVFYLANTLLCQQKFEEAAELYKKRVDLGGWQQEVYFSMYQLVKIYARLQKPIEAEYWAQRANETDPERNEALLA
jgi:tetratricopeptide (TPR) repeat protein